MAQADYSLLRPTQGINTPFENLGAILALRSQQEGQRALSESRQAAAEQARERTQQLQQQQVDTAAIDAAFQSGKSPEEILGLVPGHLKEKIQKQFADATDYNNKAQEAKQKAELAEREYFGHLAASVKSYAPDGPQAMIQAAQAAIRTAKAHGHDVSPWEAALQQDPSKLPQLLDGVIAFAQGPQKPPASVSPGEGVLNQTTGKYEVPVPKDSTSGKPASVQEYEYAVQHDGFKGTFKQYQDEDANRKQKAAAERAPYFTYQPLYDKEGRPTGKAIRFDARGGPAETVDVAGISGGGLLKPPPGTTGAQSLANEVSTEQLDRLKQMFNDGAAAFIGPVAGRAQSIGQKLPGVPVNKTYADFEAASAAFRNSVIKAITGAQMSEREADRIRQQIPDVTDKPQVWLSKATQTRKNLQDLAAILAKKSGGAPPPPAAASNGRVYYDANGNPIKK